MTRGAVIALSHGGGPMPLLGDPRHTEIIKSLRSKVPKILRLGTENAPRAIVLVTAHWSETTATVSSGKKPALLYDYYGFPDESYKLQYNAPGSPEIAQEVAKAFKNSGLQANLDNQRGWDHGVFVPMLLINPDANVPVVQVSVLASESPENHLKMGTALRSLRDSNVAIIGSGFASIHNTRVMLTGMARQNEFRQRNKDWSDHLWDAVKQEDTAVRFEKLQKWRDFPNAYEMHPKDKAEHFMPLLVCASAGGSGVAKCYKDEFLGLDVFSYYWDQ